MSWIKLHRSLKDWEWYDDINAVRLLIHLLVSVNFEDKKWKGMVIPAGSMVFSWESLSEQTGLTIKQCRIAMQKLENSGEAARKGATKGQLVTLTKWEKLQKNETERASNRAAKGQQKGRERATTKEYKEVEEGKEEKKGRFAPPSLLEVQNEIKEKGYSINAESFIAFYESKGWMIGKNKMKSWTAALVTWNKRMESQNPAPTKSIYYD